MVGRLAARLAEEGIDTGHLADLWDNAFASAPEGRPAGSALMPPHQIPAGIAYFTGRAAEMDALTGMADDAALATGTVVISAISGTAGVGKPNPGANTSNRYQARASAEPGTRGISVLGSWSCC